MIIEDDNATPPDTNADLVADAPADTAPQPTADESAASAFDQGVENAVPNDDNPDGGARDAADVAAAATTTPVADAGTAAPVAAVVPPVVAPIAPVPDASVETEIKSLGLKAKAAERFRELTSTLKAKESEIEPLRQASQKLAEWDGFLQQSGVPPEQLGMMIEVGKALNGTNLVAKGKAFDTMLTTIQQLGQELGRDVPGLIDPLAQHPDLKQAVENGDITEAFAKKTAQDRAQAALNNRTLETTTAAQSYEQAVTGAYDQIRQLGQNLKHGNAQLGVAADPFFDAKYAMLVPMLSVMEETVPPAQWPTYVARLWSQLPTPSVPAAAPATANAPVRVGHMPLRPGNTGNGLRPVPKDEYEAFDMGAFGTVGGN